MSRDAHSEPVSATRWQLPVRVTAFGMWLAFVVFCVGLVVAHGLCCADDAWFAVIAKSVATGLGYATTFAKHGETLQPILFNPDTGTGPMLIFPAALALKLFGKSELIPGLTAVACWGGMLTILLLRVARHSSATSLLLGVGLFCFAILATFPYHFEQWFAFIGEVPAAALLLLAHWMLAAEKFSARSIFFAGLCMGLAVQTKYQAVIATAGAFIIFLVQLKRSGCGLPAALRYTGLLLAACVIPTALFELYKLSQLGFGGYTQNWKEFLVASREMGIQSGTRIALQLLAERMASLHERFGLRWWGVIVVLAGSAVLFARSVAQPWRRVFSALLVSVLVSGIYWAALSVGRPRYAIISIVMLCFLLVVPVIGLPRWWQKGFCAAAVCLLLSAGIKRSPYIIKSADRGLFRPTTERLARMQLVRQLENARQNEPVQLASRYWGSFADVEFLLPGSMNFKRIETVEGGPGKKLILINSRFNDPSDYGINSARQRASSKVFAGGPYELLELPAPSPPP